MVRGSKTELMQVDKGDLTSDDQETPGHWTRTEKMSFLTTVTHRFRSFPRVAGLLFLLIGVYGPLPGSPGRATPPAAHACCAFHEIRAFATVSVISLTSAQCDSMLSGTA